jgi:hypothetical protein
MIRSIAVCLAILAVSSSTAFAAQRSRHHAQPAAATDPVTWPGSSNESLHAKNHRDSAYGPKSDYNANGTMRTDDGGPSWSGGSQAAHRKNHRDSGYSSKRDYNANGTMRVN